MSVKISERSDTLRRFRDLGLTQKEIIDAYHILEYELGVAQQIAWANTSWLGYRLLKLPTDMFLAGLGAAWSSTWPTSPAFAPAIFTWDFSSLRPRSQCSPSRRFCRRSSGP